MAGIFGRCIRDERLARVFGFFADVSSDDDFYVPYVGSTWTIDQRDPALAVSAVRAHRRHFFPVGRGALRRHRSTLRGQRAAMSGSASRCARRKAASSGRVPLVTSHGIGYGGHRAGVLLGPSGERIELIESAPPTLQ